MYVVTFYSFKGGVGRTMAMMNCAAKLMSEDKKVLVVDFDLEAPGLETFDLRLGRKKKKGVVDYVCDYIDKGIAPDIESYLHKGSFKYRDSDHEGELWIMPAGNQVGDYHNRLNSINWKQLYKSQDGFLLFENLKAQWKDFLNPDYVLIDSRTGHTDISGICTRQLPDAIVFLFFPNEQNLLGLAKVVERVRKEQKNLKLHFVTSNVPDMDDEHSILGRRLASFHQRLGYIEPASVIHHYPSLSLLNQELFVVTRPRSRLAGEYKELADKIQTENPNDRKGALMYLAKLDTDKGFSHYRARATKKSDSEYQRLEQILAHHRHDSVLLDRIVTIKERRGEFEDAAQIIDQMLETNPDNPTFLVRASRLAHRMGSTDKAIEYAMSATKFGDLSVNELIQVTRVFKLQNPEYLESILSWPSIAELASWEIFELTKFLSFENQTLKIAENLIRLNESKSDGEEERIFSNELIINLIGQRRFSDARELSEREMGKFGYDTVTMFNFAMAKWGETKRVAIDEFRLVTGSDIDETNDETTEANHCQCMSLVYWGLNDLTKSTEWLEKAKQASHSKPVSTFSSWTYLYARSKEFLEHLESQESLIRGENILPAVFYS